MRILCGYNGVAKLKPETHLALSRWADGNRVDFIDVSGSNTAYWHAIRDRWTGQEDLVIVEQDNVIHADVMPSFKDCEDDWCVYTYWGPSWLPEVFTHMKFSLGCTKFSAALQRKIPHSDIGGDYMVWFLIDERFSKLFRMHGYYPHVHGEVGHLHEYEKELTPFEQRRTRAIYDHVYFKNQFFKEE